VEGEFHLRVVEFVAQDEGVVGWIVDFVALGAGFVGWIGFEVDRYCYGCCAGDEDYDEVEASFHFYYEFYRFAAVFSTSIRARLVFSCGRGMCRKPWPFLNIMSNGRNIGLSCVPASGYCTSGGFFRLSASILGIIVCSGQISNQLPAKVCSVS